MRDCPRPALLLYVTFPLTPAPSPIPHFFPCRSPLPPPLSRLSQTMAHLREMSPMAHIRQPSTRLEIKTEWYIMEHPPTVFFLGWALLGRLRNVRLVPWLIHVLSFPHYRDIAKRMRKERSTLPPTLFRARLTENKITSMLYRVESNRPVGRRLSYDTLWQYVSTLKTSSPSRFPPRLPVHSRSNGKKKRHGETRQRWAWCSSPETSA